MFKLIQRKDSQNMNGRIDPVQEALLDAALNRDDQKFISESVRQLKADELSLSWRSELNQKLVSLQPSAKAPSRLRWWHSFSGVAVAGALAVAFLVPRPQVSGTSPEMFGNTIESEIVSAHVVAHRTSELTPSSTVQHIQFEQSESLHDFSEADLGTL